VSAGINRQAPLSAVFFPPDFSYNHPFSVPYGIAAASDHPSFSSLDYITNVSFVNFLSLVLCINFFLSPPSCRLQENPSIALITLVRRLSKLFQLIFQSLYNNMPSTDIPPTDAKSVDTTGLGFVKLEGVFIRFGPHWKNLTVHKSLYVAYSQNLPDLDDLFSDGSSRTELKSNVIKLIRKQLVDCISIRATS